MNTFCKTIQILSETKQKRCLFFFFFVCVCVIFVWGLFFFLKLGIVVAIEFINGYVGLNGQCTIDFSVYGYMLLAGIIVGLVFGLYRNISEFNNHCLRKERVSDMDFGRYVMHMITTFAEIIGEDVIGLFICYFAGTKLGMVSDSWRLSVFFR